MALWLRQWRGKPAQPGQAAVLPYANGLPKYYKLSLGARIIRLCAAATASTSAVVIAWSFLSPVFMVAPFLYVVSEVIFAAVSWRRWVQFNDIQHDARGGVLPRRSDAAVAPAVIDPAAAAARFEAVASALARGGPAEVAAFLRLWFHDRPLCEIGRGNLLDLLAYAFFYAQSSSAVAAQGHGDPLEAMADRLEALLHPPPATSRPHHTHLPTSLHSGIGWNHPPQQVARPSARSQTFSACAPDAAAADADAMTAAATATAAAGAPSGAATSSDTFRTGTGTGTASSSSRSGDPAPRVLHPGRNPRLRFMAHMTEPLPHFWRPLVFYAAMEAMAWINHCMLVGAGYRRVAPRRPDRAAAPAKAVMAASAIVDGSGCGSAVQAATWAEQEDGAAGDSEGSNTSSSSCGGGGGGGRVGGGGGSCGDDHYCYVVNLPPAREEGARGLGAGSAEACDAGPEVPIVFLHGVGMGLMPYFRLLVALAATGAPIIAFELKHVSQRWTSGEPPSMQQLADDVVSALRRHGYSQAAVLAHSFGTAVASVLMQSYPSVVRHVTMLDPICFQMYAPRLLRNFIYRRLGATGMAAAAHAAVAAAVGLASGAPTATGSVPLGSVDAAEGGGPHAAAAAITAASIPVSGDGDADGATAAAAAAPPAFAHSQPAWTASAESQAVVAGDAATAAAAPPVPSISGPSGVGGFLSAASTAARITLGLPLDLLMLGPARELHCTALLCRRMVWSEVNLWEHMVPESCTVVLSGRDDLMCARSLERWLRDHTPATVVVHPELLHAQICLAWTRQDQVLDQMLRNVYGSGERGGGEVYDSQHAVAAVSSSAPPRVRASLDEDVDGAFGSRFSGAGEQEEGEVECCGAGPGASRGSAAAAVATAPHDVDSDVEMEASGGLRRGPRRLSRRPLDDEGVCALGESAQPVSGGSGGGCSPRLGRRRRRFGGAFAKVASVGGANIDFAGDDGGGEGGGEASPLLMHPSVVRHDSAGSYLRLQSIGGLEVSGSEAAD